MIECADQISIFDIMYEPIRIKKPIRLIELFAGYGSQAMALERIGANFEHYRVVEFDKYAIKSYNAVHGTDFPTMDITKVHASDLNICDTESFTYLLTYSFPCTDLSVAGKQAGMKKGSGTRSGLLWEVERILKEIWDKGGELPQILFMENVPQVHSDDNMPDFQNWIDFLTSLGYVNYWKDLNATDYGVAQNRNRCYMFSFLNRCSYKFPQPVVLTNRICDYLEKSVDSKFYLSKQNIDYFVKHEQEQRKAGNSFHAVYKGVKDIAATIPSRYWKDGSNCLIKEPIVVAMRGRNPDNPSDRTAGIPTEQRLELNTKGISNALTTVQKDNLILEKYRIRKLTPRECGRLMGVTDEDISKMAEVNSNTQLYKQFGNSIVVDVMCAMFKNLNIQQEGDGKNEKRAEISGIGE